MDINNIHKGETIFVLGCGRNLCSGLTLLKNRITIGMNKILNAYDPHYLLWLDPHAVTEPREYKEMLNLSHALRICSIRASEGIDDVKTFQEYIPRDGNFFSPDLESGLVHGHSTVFAAINLAIIMDAAKIVLLGVDLNDGGHFYPEDNPPDKFPCAIAIRNEFRRVAEYADKNGIEILNASPGSSVTSFKKVKLISTL